MTCMLCGALDHTRARPQVLEAKSLLPSHIIGGIFSMHYLTKGLCSLCTARKQRQVTGVGALPLQVHRKVLS